MLPETTTPAGEAAYGKRIVWITIAWIVLTVLAGVFLVLVRPALNGVY